MNDLLIRYREYLMMILLGIMVLHVDAAILADSIGKITQERRLEKFTEVNFMGGHSFFASPFLNKYPIYTDEGHSGNVLYLTMSRSVQTKYPRLHLGCSFGMAYRNYWSQGSSSDMYKTESSFFTGDFVESFGSLNLRYLTHNMKHSSILALMPIIDLWGKYEEHARSSTTNFGSHSWSYNYRRFENKEKYWCSRISFRMMLGYHFRISENLRFQVAFLPGISSQIASMDICVGVGWEW